MKYYLTVIILFFVLISSLFSANLITKDDFSCYVSGSVSLTRSMNNVDVAFYSDNSFIQVIQDWSGTDYFTQFYPDGTVKKSIEKYFPFAGDSSAVYDFNIFSTVSVNESDFSVFPIYTNLAGETNNYINVIDQQGAAVADPICFTCDDSMFTTFNNWYSRTDIGYSGVIGNVNIYTDTAGGNLATRTNMIVVRFYFPVTGLLSDPIIVTDQANPLPNLAGYNDTLYRTNEPVILKIFQDNSFVVAWQNSYALQERVYYRVYNSDMTPRTAILRADCENAVNGCLGYERVQQFSVANELDGDFYISWVGVDSSDYTHHVWIRGFNADGSPKYNLIRANEHNSLYTNHFASTGYIHQKVVCNNSGELLVTWGQGAISEKTDMITQKIDALGNLVGHNYRINNNNAATLKNIPYACDLSDDGQAVFMWTYLDENSEQQVSAQLMPYSQVGVFVPGDINYDMQADISDLITQVEYMFANVDYRFFPDAVIDFNGDGGLGDISDLVYLVNYMFGSGPPPQSLDPGIRPNPTGN